MGDGGLCVASFSAVIAALVLKKVSDRRRTAMGLTRPDLGIMIAFALNSVARVRGARRREQYPYGLTPWRYAAEQNEVDANEKSPNKGGCR
jgi:hypothetical protein